MLNMSFSLDKARAPQAHIKLDKFSSLVHLVLRFSAVQQDTIKASTAPLEGGTYLSNNQLLL
jgi:hypothetical protein